MSQSRLFWSLGCRCMMMMMAALGVAGLCQAESREVQTPDALVQALNDPAVNDIVVISGVYLIAPVSPGSDVAAIIERDLSVRGSAQGDSIIRGGGPGSNFRFASIGGPNDISVQFNQLVIENFSVDGDGGVFLVGNDANPVDLTISNSTLSNNSASGNGGGIAAREESIVRLKAIGMEVHNANRGGAIWSAGHVEIFNSIFRSNQVRGDRGAAIFIDGVQLVVNDSQFIGNRVNGSGDGGAVAIEGQTLGLIQGNRFFDNQDISNSANNISLSGLAIDACVIFKSLGCINALIEGNSFVHQSGNIGDVSVRQREGTMALRNNTFKNIPDNGSALIYSAGRLVDGGVTLRGNLIDIDGFSPGGGKDLCRDFAGVGLLQSEGYNIMEDDTCLLDATGDQRATDPLLETETDDGVVALKPGSPAIDAALAAGLSNASGCSYKDIRGLGRPQDGNIDGIFECDSGSWELQGGPDIGAAQSAAYFDTNRNGEGVFVEILDDGLAFVAMFTYAPGGSGLAWFVGLGRVVGNSVVIDEVLQTSGGVFGGALDPGAIVRTDVGGMALVFSTCESVKAPGRLSFEGQFDGPFGDLLSVAGRLTTIVDCGQSPGPTSGRSGSFYDPARDGEGIFVQWLSNGDVVVIWYTYDPQGNQFWTISSAATVTGNTVTANMLYPATGTGFGGNFDASEIQLQNWGSVTLTYNSCGSVDFAFNSVLPGFGSGAYSYSRLTTLAGTSCDL